MRKRALPRLSLSGGSSQSQSCGFDRGFHCLERISFGGLIRYTFIDRSPAIWAPGLFGLETHLRETAHRRSWP